MSVDLSSAVAVAVSLAGLASSSCSSAPSLSKRRLPKAPHPPELLTGNCDGGGVHPGTAGARSILCGSRFSSRGESRLLGGPEVELESFHRDGNVEFEAAFSDCHRGPERRRDTVNLGLGSGMSREMRLSDSRLFSRDRQAAALGDCRSSS